MHLPQWQWRPDYCLFFRTRHAAQSNRLGVIGKQNLHPPPVNRPGLLADLATSQPIKNNM